MPATRALYILISSTQRSSEVAIIHIPFKNFYLFILIGGSLLYNTVMSLAYPEPVIQSEVVRKRKTNTVY